MPKTILMTLLIALTASAQEKDSLTTLKTMENGAATNRSFLQALAPSNLNNQNFCCDDSARKVDCGKINDKYNPVIYRLSWKSVEGNDAYLFPISVKDSDGNKTIEFLDVNSLEGIDTTPVTRKIVQIDGKLYYMKKAGPEEIKSIGKESLTSEACSTSCDYVYCKLQKNFSSFSKSLGTAAPRSAPSATSP
jgi:hypothetical protein